jgi:hypothetical protein
MQQAHWLFWHSPAELGCEKDKSPLSSDIHKEIVQPKASTSMDPAISTNQKPMAENCVKHKSTSLTQCCHSCLHPLHNVAIPVYIPYTMLPFLFTSLTQCSNSWLHPLHNVAIPVYIPYTM